MSEYYTNEPMLDMFIFETSQLLEQLEQIILESEKEGAVSEVSINEIFRIMHTIKGSAAMMMFQDISSLAHTIEDLFYFLREEKPAQVDYGELSDLILRGGDFIRIEIEKIKNNDEADGNASALIEEFNRYLSKWKDENKFKASQTSSQEEKQKYYISQNKDLVVHYKNAYQAVIYFEDGCEMENIRAYTIIHNLKEFASDISYIPADILDNDDTKEMIRRDGFRVFLKTDYTYDQLYEFFQQTIFLKDMELTQLEEEQEAKKPSADLQVNPVKMPHMEKATQPEAISAEENQLDSIHKSAGSTQSIISVNVAKLDKLMDLVGEMVISKAMVIQNPDLQGLELDNFQKAASQLSKITMEIQDTVMSIRMVPLSVTFQRMHRIVRDMCKKLNKDVRLEMIGEETEVDKNIIEHISDPLMHLVRNSIDHGIESTDERMAMGKPKTGTITLEAKNAGSDVLITVRDDGKGLNREKILKKARENKLLYKDENEMTDKEIFNLILLPGFSTKENITEYSGRGVGMDVVCKNVEMIGGSIAIESKEGKGTAITMKIPLTLAIIDGMIIKVGKSSYTIPITTIKESFRPKEKDTITDPDGNEMIMVRGKFYPIIRLHEKFNVQTDITDFCNGIIIMVEQDEKEVCLFADELVGQQEVVVKALPEYLKRFKKVNGLAGCTLLGDGSISLILDIGGLINY